MKSSQPVSLAAWLKGLNGELILMSEFMNLEISILVELILISEITNSEIRITSTLRYL